jgi:D-beta-D-heptose 7-phosphate kinase/D-beta-D-heptose 1-phosphate adenosyltransferase
MKTSVDTSLEQVAGKRILVLGDVMLDHYIWGDVERISPEAPVPVVRVSSENDMPGAAANVAVNLAALDAQPVMLSIIGADRAGERLRELLEQHNVDCRYLVTDDKLQTTCKERIIARSQHVVRVDWDTVLDRETLERSNILSAFTRALGECDGIVIQDYNKGMLNQKFFDIARDVDIPVVVDPNRYHSIRYHGTVATPNLEEARILAGSPCSTTEAIDRLPDIARRIFERHDLEHLVITLGERGIALCEPSGSVQTHPAARTHNVYDVSGAGDTVAAVLAAALSAGVELWTACLLANAAGSIVVGKMGTATTSREEIQNLIETTGLTG